MRYYYVVFQCFILSLLTGSAQAQTAAPATDTTRLKHDTYSERMPVFPVLAPGDNAVPSNQRFMRFLNADVHFPARALRDGISGRVYFSFAVNAQGRVQDIKLVKGLGRYGRRSAAQRPPIGYRSSPSKL